MEENQALMLARIAARVVVEQVQSEQTETQEVALAERVLLNYRLCTQVAAAAAAAVVVVVAAAVLVAVALVDLEQQEQQIRAVVVVEPVRLPLQEIPQAA